MNDEPVAFQVFGTPKPQGSKRHVGRGILVEASPGLKDWRTDVTVAAAAAMESRLPLEGPLHVSLAFRMPKPKSRRKEVWPITRPDLDKLVRGVLDGMTAGGVWRDDSQAVVIHAHKLYVNEIRPVPCLEAQVRPLTTGETA